MELGGLILQRFTEQTDKTLFVPCTLEVLQVGRIFSWRRFQNCITVIVMQVRCLVLAPQILCELRLCPALCAAFKYPRPGLINDLFHARLSDWSAFEMIDKASRISFTICGTVLPAICCTNSNCANSFEPLQLFRPRTCAITCGGFSARTTI